MVEVSVIIPAYNAGSSLASTLASACNQWLRDIEILVIDDASQDQTHEIARSIASTDPRVRVIRRTTNGGPSATRNAGLDAAKGTWVALLDADDLYLPQRLSVLTDAARSTGSDMVADNILLRCPETGGCLGLAIPPVLASSRRPLAPAEFVRQDRPFPGGFQQFGYLMPLTRRAFLEKHDLRYDPDIWCAEDFVLYMQCLLAGARMMLLPDAYYQYTLSHDSVSRTGDNLARNYEHLESGNARILALARRQGDRATVVQLKRRGRNIAFLRAYYGCRHAVQRRRWPEALVHLLRMPFAPVEFARLLSLHVSKRISRTRGIRLLTGRLDQVGKSPVC